ncbi:MAG: helicase-exonuclease AddAB subunit AddA, partial [Lachnospiraceae bacterium]|nr:helicase-exonuclease AddAB subunit AddA [Candidatus Equihabitans merdae]
MLNLLSVLDNERQDIPFVSLMTSVVAGFTGEELAQIRGHQPDNKEACFCDAVKAYIENGPDRALAFHLNAFMETLEDYRRRAVYTPIRELIEEILTETGFGVYAASLPGGERREANLRALCEKAAVYEKTSYVGLFNFVRYIRTLEKYEQDPEVASFGGASDAVRILTIHSSKGLEYPVVFVSSMGKGFNTSDLNAMVLTDPFYGIASDYVDYENRVKMPTLKKEAIRHRLKKESIGEELRVLYVAMTRAKMKLILTGAFDKKDWRKDQEQRRLEEGRLSAATITEVGCYYDLVLPVVLSHENDETKQFDLREYDKDAFILSAEEELEYTRLGIDYLENMDLNQISDQEMHDIIQERFNYHSPEEGSSTTPMKVSVSYVKQEHMQDEDGVRADQPEKPRSVIPEFKKDQEERQYLWGADLGTAYHDVLYRLDFPSCCDDSG